jgi:hypothetical protein
MTKYKPYEAVIQTVSKININSGIDPAFVIAWCKGRAELSRPKNPEYSDKASRHLEDAAHSIAAAYGIDYNEVIPFTPIEE